MIIQKRTREFIREISEETGLSFNQIRDMVLSAQFKFITEEMRSADKSDNSSFTNVMLRHLGSFDVSYGKVNKIKEAVEAKRIREEGEDK